MPSVFEKKTENEWYEREGTISLKKADIFLYRGIDSLERAWRELTNVRDFLPLDRDNIITCINLIQEASRIAKQAYWEYLETEYHSKTATPLLNNHLTEETLERIAKEVK